MGCLLMILSALSGLIIFISLFHVSTIIDQCNSGNYTIVCLDATSFFIITTAILWRRIDVIKVEYSNKERTLRNDLDQKNKDLERDYKSKNDCLEHKYKSLMQAQNLREEKMKDILKSSYPLSYVSSLYADTVLYLYDETMHVLKTKKYPALSAAKEVKKLKIETRSYISKYKEMLYKYEFLLSTFPDLKRYVDDDESLLSLGISESYDTFEAKRDRASDYLNKEEWDKLGVDERNQLALDRYRKKNKSNWVIGIEYEMYIDYLLRKNGFVTIPFGSIKGIEDLGRDIIAKKINEQGELVTYIIQCKNWASNKEIHENVICQLFGTAVAYDIQNKMAFSKTVPVLYSTARLSETAMEFAKRLGVVVRVTEKKDYPMIKCNVNSDGSKIYHLPFDQQYYRTQICKSGEFYAWTVNEAVTSGFRRAFKYSVNAMCNN